LVLSGGTLYGMAQYGFHGSSLGNGGVYKLIVHPSLQAALSGGRAALSWNDPSYFLYSAPTLTNTFTKVAGPASPYTNSVAGVQRFFETRPN